MLLPRIERLSAPPKRTDIAEHVKTDEDTYSVCINYTHYKPNSWPIFYWISTTSYKYTCTCSYFKPLRYYTNYLNWTTLHFIWGEQIWGCRTSKYNSMKISFTHFIYMDAVKYDFIEHEHPFLRLGLDCTIFSKLFCLIDYLLFSDLNIWDK